MTLAGTKTKTLILAALCIGTAFFTWGAPPELAGSISLGAIVIGVILCFIICMKPKTAPFLAPIYAIAEGAALGIISCLFEDFQQGIVQQAILITLAVFCAMLGAYTLRIIRPTRKFVGIVTGMTLGIMVAYLFTLFASGFGHPIYLFDTSNPWGIAISVIICAVAAANLIVDFGVIEAGVTNGAPKYMEWYGAFGILVTLVWLYIEVLRLLRKLSK